MNYFGHAAFAIVREQHAEFVLGAMLPDLAVMVDLALPGGWLETMSDILRRGVTFHYETDAVFHEAEVFVRWNHRACAELQALGVRRGPARAMAHMGVEFLLDAHWAKDERLVEAYVAALRHGATLKFPPSGPRAPSRSQLAALLDELSHLGARVHVAAPERFRLRFERALAGRARLEPTPAELECSVDYFAHLDLKDDPEHLRRHLEIQLRSSDIG